MTTSHDPARNNWRDASGVLLDEEDRGLRYDLPQLSRRGVLGLFGGLGVAALAGCAATTTTSAATTAGVSSATTTGTATATAAASGGLFEAPSETGGPYPADGKGGQGGASANVLDDAGIVRRDITSSFGGPTGKAEGVPLTVTMMLKDMDTSKALVGAAVYLWHADRDGRYSMYSTGVTGENYLRGVQVTDASGSVTFTTIFPGCYDGRWPHIHFEVYRDQAAATSGGQIMKTSQIALPKSACDEAYAQTGYSASVGNLSRVSLATDNVFRDDQGIHQLPVMSGSATVGFTAAITFGI